MLKFITGSSGENRHVCKARPGGIIPRMRGKLKFDRQEAMARVEMVRAIAGLSKRQFALSLGIAPTNYGGCLRGAQFLTADHLFTLWQKYGADPAYVMGGRKDGLPLSLAQRIAELEANA